MIGCAINHIAMAPKKSPKPTPGNFVFKTISLPPDVFRFAKARASEPDHAGNVSGYIRRLIIQDCAAHPAHKRRA